MQRLLVRIVRASSAWRVLLSQQVDSVLQGAEGLRGLQSLRIRVAYSTLFSVYSYYTVSCRDCQRSFNGRNNCTGGQ